MHSSPPTPQLRRRLAMTQRIIDAATEIVVEGGFDALSVQRIAAALDYTPGAMYRYFPSKDALVSAVVVGIIEDVGVFMREVAGITALERLRTLAFRWGAFAKDAPHRFGLIQVLMATPQVILADAALAAPAIDAMFRAMDPVRAALCDAADEGALKPGDASRRALVLFAGLQGALMLRKQSRHVPALIAPDLLFRDVLETLIAGWTAGEVPDRGASSNGSRT